MSTKSKSYAEHISSAQVMMAGLRTNLDRLQKRGVTEEFIGSLDGSLNGAIAQNNVQEKLKADLKSSTAALNHLMEHLDVIMKEATKVVKLEMPQSQWKEFGITSKR